MEAESGIAAVHVAFEPAEAVRAALMSVTGGAVLIVPDEHHIVMVCGFIDHVFPDEGQQDVTVNAAVTAEIAEQPSHISSLAGQCKGLFLFLCR